MNEITLTTAKQVLDFLQDNQNLSIETMIEIIEKFNGQAPIVILLNSLGEPRNEARAKSDLLEWLKINLSKLDNGVHVLKILNIN